MEKQTQQVNIDISNVPNLKCDGEFEGEVCGGEIFVPISYIKVVSKLLSPTGKEFVVNVEDHMCDNCGKTLNEIMHDKKKIIN